MKFERLAFGLAIAVLAACGGGAVAQEERRQPDVLWIMLDTLSPDFLAGFGGSAVAPTPNLDALAARGAVFTECWSVTPDRRLGILAQLWSHDPGVIESLRGTEETPGAPSQFEDRGFRVTGIFGKALLEPGPEPIGKFLPGFGFPARGWEYAQSEEKIVGRLKMVAESSRDDRLFTWVHLPWTNPPARQHPGVPTAKGDGGHWRASLEYADRQIGRLIATLETAGRLESTLVVFTASRGLRALPGDDVHRDDALDAAALRIPLLFAGAGVKAGRHDGARRSTDILPTILDFLGQDAEYSNQGHSFAPLLRGETAEERILFAEHVPFVGEEAETRVQMASDGKWILRHRPLDRSSALVQRGDASGRDRAAESPEVARRLAAALEADLVADLACARVWAAGENRFPDLAGAEGFAFRSRFQIARSDPAARETVASLLADGRGDPLEGLSLLLACGLKEDARLAEPLLSHKDPRVQAMAGAFLASRGDLQRGVDHAVQGLRDDMPEARLLEILDVLGKTGSELARSAIERFQPRDPSPGYQAYRDLALARLEDPAARKRLPRHLLAAAAEYPIRPFIDAIVELDRAKAGIILGILLEHSTLDAADAIRTLAVLRELSQDRAAAPVARLVRHPAPPVRTAARALLREWGSAAAASFDLDHAVTARSEIAPALESLAAEPGLLGSPILPGLRFDLWSARETAPGARPGELPPISGRSLDLRLNLPVGLYERVALAFVVADDSTSAEKIAVAVRLNENDAPLATIETARRGGVFWWIGELPEDALDPGTNRVRIRADRSDGKDLDAKAVAIAFVPAAGRKLVPIAGLDALRGRVETSAPVRRESRIHRIHCQGTGPGTLVVACAGKVLARIPLADAAAGVIRDLSLPAPLPVDARVEMKFEGSPAGALAFAFYFAAD